MEVKLKEGITFGDVLIIPKSSDIAPYEASLRSEVAKGLFLDIPFLSAAMDRVTDEKMAIALAKIGALGILHRSCTTEEQLRMLKKVKKEDLMAGAACGPFDLERAVELEKVGADAIVVDCAHGHNRKVINSAKEIKRKLKRAKVIVGNIATAEAAKDLASFADAIKVGVGPGSICTTRIVGGAGVPQFTAIVDVVSAAKKSGVPVIADGGMSNSGDAAKAMAAGAGGLMFGSMFAAAEEAPGKVIVKNGEKFKEYRGMGSRAVMAGGKSKDRYLADGKKPVPEGVEALIKCNGTIYEIVEQLAGGIRIAMGYVGARDIKTLHKKAEFIKISNSAKAESAPHGLGYVVG